jgi:hypothetical protein
MNKADIVRMQIEADAELVRMILEDALALKSPHPSGAFDAIKRLETLALSMVTKYPQGKLTADDEGETQIAITVQDNAVIVAFTKPMNWIGLDYDSAKTIGEALLRRAEEIRQ